MMNELLILAASYGFIAGISPGPLLALIITHTLRMGLAAGAVLVLIPLVYEPLIIGTFFVFSQVLSNAFIAGISLVGSLFLGYLGYQSFLPLPKNFLDGNKKEMSRNLWKVFRDGIVLQIFNPHPYIFWGTVALPLLRKADAVQGKSGVVYFLCVFYAVLVSSKISISFLVDRGRDRLTMKGYTFLIRSTGIALWIFAGLTLWNVYSLLNA